MSLRPYKFIVQAIVQELDDAEVVTGEKEAQPVVVFGVESLVSWANDFPKNLATITE